MSVTAKFQPEKKNSIGRISRDTSSLCTDLCYMSGGKFQEKHDCWVVETTTILQSSFALPHSRVNCESCH